MLVSDLPTTISTITRTQYVSQNAHLGWVDQAPLEHTTTCIILPFPIPQTQPKALPMKEQLQPPPNALLPSDDGPHLTAALHGLQQLW